MASVKTALQKYFDIMDLRPVKWLLGIYIEYDWHNHTITLSQMPYIDAIVAWFKMGDGFKVKTPIDMSCVLSKNLSLATEKDKH